MKHILLLIASLLLLPITAESADNYCLDAKTNSTWAKMLSESPHDDLVAELFALRIGLCELVKRKTISLDRATAIFEEARGRAVVQRKADELRQKHLRGGNT
ncbi:hypothetical protein [Mariprofundus ferrooxydans]|uniref:hypothetical protein n=1 Tax=Mariprofundus ferrooxydans TaxID=314344 RepID=UPI0005931584|nr:hypothetical protein [Mariprofundus ferrooxydans]KON48270.1 hypothetical protein AL013_04345 [Mariprofundus ferrooxydans]